ncbi:MAG: hypothetical protein PVI90_01085 [Desulfobacteraceae bacterium]|jgi:hypothetical protein
MADTVFVVGKKGHIWQRSEGGVWSEHSIGAMSTNDHFYGIHGLSNSEVYAVGFTGTSSISSSWYYKWNGTSWSVWSDAPSLPAGYGPTAIFCFASDSIYLTYTNGYTATSGGIMYWNGSTWTTIDSGTYKPYAIWGTAANDVYFGCRVPGAGEIKKWNGSTIANSASVNGGTYIGHLYGSSDGTLFASGSQPNTHGIWRGVWDTLSATVVANIEMTYYSSLTGWNNIFSDNGKAWAFGNEYLDNEQPIVAIYDGSWSTSQLKNQAYAPNIAVAGTTEPAVIAVYGDYSGINIPPNDATAFIWADSTWTEEFIGDGGDFLPTDAWASSIPIAVDTDPPVLSNLSPDDSDINVPVDTTISLDITDVDSGVDVSSVDISVEGVYAWHNDSQQTGFSVVKSSITDGYRYVITPDVSFGSYQTVDVDVYAEDLATTPNVLDTAYSFRTVDTEAPYLTNRDPAPDETGVSVSTTVSLDILDVGDGVDVDSVVIEVDSVVAWQNDAQQTGFSVVKSSVTDGYRYVITPDTAFDPYVYVTIDVYADDLATTPNTLDTSYSFQTADSDAPILDNLSPNDSDINVPVDTTISLDILDIDSGVDVDSVSIKVEGVYAWQNDVEQTGFSVVKTSVTYGYRYVITPDTSFGSYQTVDIDVYAEDSAPTPNVLDTAYSFRTVDTEAPYLANHDPAPDETGVSPLTSIYLDVLDDGDPLNASSVVITIDGTIAWQSDALQNSYTGSKTTQPKGYRYALTPPTPLPMSSLIEVSVQAADSAPTPNELDTTYSFTTTVDIPPEVRNIDPYNGQVDVSSNKKIEFDAWDNAGIDEVETSITINSTLAYQSSSSQNGFTVTVVPIVNGYHYEIAAPTNWTRGGTVTVAVQIKDILGVTTNASWIFYIYGLLDCFTGPINSFETSLLVPYDMAATKLYHTEILRNMLLSIANTQPDPIKAVRQIYLQAFRSELAPILRGIVPSPTTREKNVKLCYKRTIIQIDAILRSKPNLLRGALAELRSIGLPVPHNTMLYRYLSTDEPNDLVPLACVVIVLAKALEVNALS